MTHSSPILDLPYIQPSQAQKHVTHNEAIRALDVLVQLVVQSCTLQEPPATVEANARYIVAAPALGVWLGHDNQIAHFDGQTWSYFTAQPGWVAVDLETNSHRSFDGLEWSTLDLSQIAYLGVQTTADDTNRLSVVSDATLLSHDGGGHQLKLNKAAQTDTSSIVFQTDFSGRAEIGTAGGENFSIKVSSDGTTWTDALTVDAASGEVQTPQSKWRRVWQNPPVFFVDPILGNDAADGLTAGVGAFETLRQAFLSAKSIDAGGHPVTIKLASGTYNFPDPLEIDFAPVGASRMIIEGDVGAPDQVLLSGGNSIFVATAGITTLRGLKLQNTSGGLPTVAVADRGTVELDTVEFGAAGGHLSAIENGTVVLDGPCGIVGDAKYFLKLTDGGSARMRSQTISLVGSPDFESSFVICARCSVARMDALVFSGTATGRRYLVSDNAVITTNNSGAAYFPGDEAGVANSGGVYD